MHLECIISRIAFYMNKMHSQCILLFAVYATTLCMTHIYICHNMAYHTRIYATHIEDTDQTRDAKHKTNWHTEYE